HRQERAGQGRHAVLQRRRPGRQRGHRFDRRHRDHRLRGQGTGRRNAQGRHRALRRRGQGRAHRRRLPGEGRSRAHQHADGDRVAGDPGDLRDDGLRPDRGVAGGVVPDPHPLHLDVAAVPHRQRLVRRLPADDLVRAGGGLGQHLPRPVVSDRDRGDDPGDRHAVPAGNQGSRHHQVVLEAFPPRRRPERAGVFSTGTRHARGDDFLHMRRTGAGAGWRVSHVRGLRMRSSRSLALAALAVALAGALAGCQRAPTPDADAARAGQAAAPAADANAVVSGIDLAGIDKSVRPGDDFNAYANGAWERNTKIPDDRSSTGAFVEVFELAEKRTADLIQGLDKTDPPAGSEARKIADYYAAYMDEDGIEQRGLAPLQPVLDEVDAIDSVTALSRYIGGSVRADTDPLNYTHFHTGNLFGVFVARGLEGPRRNVATLMQGGLGMPDREYYLSDAEAMAKNRE